MTDHEIRLSVEEFTYLLFMRGARDAAMRVMAQAAPDLTEAQLQERLLAAGHSLLAHQLCRFSEGKLQPTAEVQAMLDVMLAATVTLRASISTRELSADFLYYQSVSSVVMQRAEFDLVYRFRRHDGSDVAAAVLQDMPQVTLLPTVLNATMSRRLLEAVQQGGDAAQGAAQLKAAGVAAGTAELLAADLVADRFRGSLLRVTGANQREMIGERGVLLLGGRYLWLLRPQQDPDQLVIESVTAQSLRDRCDDLLAVAQ